MSWLVVHVGFVLLYGDIKETNSSWTELQLSGVMMATHLIRAAILLGIISIVDPLPSKQSFADQQTFRVPILNVNIAYSNVSNNQSVYF